MKYGARDNRYYGIRTTAVALMFHLLDGFVINKNKFAPIIYKTLTFLAIDVCWNVDLRKEMIKNFLTLFTDYQTIPVTILCEPFFKQIKIYLEKLDVVEA